MGTDWVMSVSSETSTEDSISGGEPPAPPARKKYKVLAESGIFKNQLHFKKGSLVELSNHAAQRFIQAGDIEDNE